VTGFSLFNFPGDLAPGADRTYIKLRQLLDAQQERGFPTEDTMLFGFFKPNTITDVFVIRA
jgi:hypothetical protein